MGQFDKDKRQKRYGQFLSGKKVAELLVALLPQDFCITNAIDPMVGSGDMLHAVISRYKNTVEITGIDVDEIILNSCRERLKNANLILSDVFSSKDIIKKEGWDLVITNPPYVRYQLLKNNDYGLPNGESIRRNLLKFIENDEALNAEEKQLYISMASNYSGLADMTVPSWILCAALVKQDGFLAMVVPETWLNRDYALPVQYLLLKCFEILTIAKDVESSWFENASVRTCLIVARRKRIGSIFEYDGFTAYMEIRSCLMGEKSFIDKLKVNDSFGIDALMEILNHKSDIKTEGMVLRYVPARTLFTKLLNSLTCIDWIAKEDKIMIRGEDKLPEELRTLLNSECIKYESLEDRGWGIGQGLRTGANEFFYGEVISEFDDKTMVRTKKWYHKDFSVKSEIIRRTLQNRKEMKGLLVKKSYLSKCIFYIRDYARARDIEKAEKSVKQKLIAVNPEMDKYISAAEVYVNPQNGKKYPELTAVKPNEKKVGDLYTSFWYMLPKLQKRHIPNICISRLSGNTAESLLIEYDQEMPIVVDANFITLWNKDEHEILIALSILNSSWFKCYMEMIGTRMGGGALKLEATQVRQFLFPVLSVEQEELLYKYGEEICMVEHIDDLLRSRIDNAIFLSIDKEKRKHILSDLNQMIKKKVSERGSHEY